MQAATGPREDRLLAVQDTKTQENSFVMKLFMAKAFSSRRSGVGV